MGKMFLMSGMSGAGKTTFAKEFAKEHGYIYLGIDDFYATYAAANGIKSPWSDPNASFDVWIKYFYAIHTLEMEGKDVVIDTNSPTVVKRVQFIDWFPNFDEHNLIYIMINDMKLQERNNKSRNRVVPKEELKRMRDEFEEPITRNPYVEHNYLIRGSEVDKWDNVQVFENVNNSFVQWEFDKFRWEN